MEAFATMCMRQGVDEGTVSSLCEDPWSVLPRGSTRTTVTATSAGWVSDIDALALGRFLVNIGAGRTHPADVLDHGAGIELAAHVGYRVEAGDALFHVDHNEDGPLPDVSDAFLIEGHVQAHAPTSRLLETVSIDDVMSS